MSSQILAGAFVPGLPHILHPGKSPAWKRLHDANQKLGKHIQEMEPEVLVIYSSQWLSVWNKNKESYLRKREAPEYPSWD